MRYIWRAFGAVGFLFILLTQFTNCDVYSDNSLFKTFTSVCEGRECFQENPEFIEIRIHSEGDIQVASDVRRFNVGGECNEGGFPSNQIVWSLYDNLGFVHDSNKVGVHSECVMGRFSTEIILTDPAGGPDRVGLRNAQGQRVQYKLEIEIRARDSRGVEHTHDLGRRQVFLVPI